MSSPDEEPVLEAFLEHHSSDVLESEPTPKEILEHFVSDELLSTLTVEEFMDAIAHYGVKGMKWGVRKVDRGHGLTMFMIKNGASKADIGAIKRGFARTSGTARVGVAVTNRRYKNVDLTKNKKARKRYEAEIYQVMNRGVKKGIQNTIVGFGLGTALVVTNPAAAVVGAADLGYRLYRVNQLVGEAKIAAPKPVVKHADFGESIIINVIFKRDKFGLIQDVQFEGVFDDDDEELEHGFELSEEAVEMMAYVGVTLDDLDSFAHYGVKGMKWGIRKDRRGSSGVKVARFGGKKTKVDDAKEASEDHVKVKSLRKKKLHELSNAEMKLVTERMNLEKKYRELNPSDHELLMRKIRKHADTATKVVGWMASPAGKALMKSLGMDEKSRKADAKAKEQIRLEKRKAAAKAKAEKKAKAKEERGKRTWTRPDGTTVRF